MLSAGVLNLRKNVPIARAQVSSKRVTTLPPVSRYTAVQQVTADADIKYGTGKQEATGTADQVTGQKADTPGAAGAGTSQTTTNGQSQKPSGTKSTGVSARPAAAAASAAWQNLFKRHDTKGNPSALKQQEAKPTGQTHKQCDTASAPAASAQSAAGQAAADAGWAAEAPGEPPAGAMEDDGPSQHPSDDEAGVSDTDASADGLYDAVTDLQQSVGGIAKLLADVHLGLVVLHRKFDAATNGTPKASAAAANDS